MTDRIAPFQAFNSSITFPKGHGIVGYPTVEEVQQAIDEVVAGLSLTPEQIEAILAAIPGAPITAVQVEALEAAVAGLDEWKAATQDVLNYLDGEKVSQAEFQSLLDALNALEIELKLGFLTGKVDDIESAITAINTAIAGLPNDEVLQQVAESLVSQIDSLGQQVLQELDNYARAKDAELSGNVSLDAATVDVIRTRLKDGSKGIVLRGYGMGTEPGLYVWGPDGKIVGRVTTTVDAEGFAKLSDPSQNIHAQALFVRALGFGEDLSDWVVALLDTPSYGKRLALLRTDDNDLDAANFFVMREDIEELVGSSQIKVHQDTPLPQPTTEQFTPRDMIASWAAYEPGLHLFISGSAVALVTLGRLEQDGNTELRLSLTGDATNHAVLRDWGTGPSWFMRQEGLEVLFLESPKGDAPFGPPTKVNLGSVLNDVQAAGVLGSAETVRTVETVTEFLTPGEWVPIPLTNGSGDTGAGQRKCEMRLNAGRVELRGLFGVPTTTGYRSGVFKITDPAYQPEFESTQPVAVWEQGVAGRFGYIHVNPDGSATVQPQNEKWNRVSLDGIWWPAKGFTGLQDRMAPSEEE